MEKKQKGQPMTWEDMEKEYGIVIERPKADNQTILQDMGMPETTVSPSSEAPKVEPTPTLPTPVPVKTTPRTETTANDRVKKTPEPTSPFPRWDDTKPAKKESYKPQESYDPYESVAISGNTAQPEVSVVRAYANEVKVPQRVRRIAVGHSAARQGVIWSEIMMPPLARRRR